MTIRRLDDDGTSLLASDITAGATSIPVSDAQWTTAADSYPLELMVGGELIVASGISTSGTQTFTGCTRAGNGVIKAHAAGTPVRVARAMRPSLGHAVSAPVPLTASPPVTPTPETPDVPTDDLVLWLDAGVDPTGGNLAVGEPYVAELGSTSGVDAQDPAVSVAAAVDVWDPDGSDDHIDTDYTPSFTTTTGELTVVVIGVWDSTDQASNFPRALSAESANSNGINITYGGGGTAELWVTVGGAITTAFRSYAPSDGLALVDGTRIMVAGTVNAGALRIYEPGLGLSDPASITGVGTITLNTVRLFRPTPDGIADRAADSPMQATLVYERALGQADLDDIADAYGLLGGGGATTGQFRTQQDLAYPGSPEHVLTALGYTSSAKISRAQLDGILDDWVASTGGTTRNVTSLATWTAAMAAAVPGDLVRVTSGFSPGSAGLNARGNRYGISSHNLTTSPAGGTAALPIILTCANGVFVDIGDTSSNEGGLDVQNCVHVWPVGFNVRNSQFGIRCQNWGGTSISAPAYGAYNSIENIGHAALSVAGWFQLITSSGGTPPAGTGNEWGFSQYAVLESNTIDGAGVISDQFGEGIYLGRGSNPGWVSYARDLWIRGNDIIDWKADGIDCKPGCSRIYLTDNAFHTGHAVFGAPLGILYVGAGIDIRPALWDEDPQIWIEGNRVYDSDLTNPNGSSVHIMGYLGLSGIRVANNLFWAHPQTGTHATWRVRMEHGTNDTNALAEYRSDPTWLINNTCWGDDSFENAGYGVPGIGPIPAGVTFDLRNNIVDDSTPATGEVDASAADFVGTVPAIGVVGSADAGGGPGSAFDLDPGSALVGAGADISDITLLINADIFNRPFASKTDPNPGAFQ